MSTVGFTSNRSGRTDTRTVDADKRRAAGIAFLAKINPEKYMAKYVKGKITLFENLFYKYKDWHAWHPQDI